MGIRNNAVLILVAISFILAAISSAMPVLGQNISGANSTINSTIPYNATTVQNAPNEFRVSNATIDQLLEIRLPYANLSGIELSIIKNQTTFLFAGTSQLLTFNPKEQGTYIAIILNNSVQIANASFNVTLPKLMIIAGKKAYSPGEIVQLYLYPKAEAQVFLNLSNTTYQLFASENSTFAFEAQEEGNYQITAISGLQEASLSISVTQPAPSISTNKEEYELGEVVAITILNAAEQDSIAIIHGGKTFNLLGNGNERNFTPQEAGSYSAAILRDSTIVAEAPFIVNEAEIPRTVFDINSNAAFQINFTELLETEKTAFQRILSISPLARLTAYVDWHENDARFKLSIIPVSQEVFIATVLSNPDIEPGNYTLVIKALVGDNEVVERAPFAWAGQHEKKETEATFEQNGTTQQLLNYTFSLEKNAVIDVKLTKHLSSLRNIIDNLLGRTIINTLAVYVEGRENDLLFKPEVEHLLADDFRVTIKASPSIRHGLYQLVVVGTTDKAIIRSNTLFGWGLNDSEIAEEISELEKAESGKFAILSSAGAHISYQLTREEGNVTTLEIPSLNSEITFFNFLERGNLSVWSSVRSPEHLNATQTYALDPSLLSYDRAVITRKFAGEAAYSCGYNLLLQQCTSEIKQLQIINNSYYETLNATKAFFEAEASPQKPLMPLRATATAPNVRFYRESPSRIFGGSKVNIRFAILADSLISNATIIDDIPAGWSSSHAVNSTHTMLQFAVTTNITVVGYTLTAPKQQNATFASKLTYAGSNGTKAENDPSSVEASNKTAITTEVNFSINNNELGRELATGITYDATFTLKSHGWNVDKETVFLWPYNSSLIAVNAITGDCRKAEIALIKGIRNLKCTWNNFPKDGERQFAAEIQVLGEGVHHSVINATYDPPRRVTVTQSQEADYEVKIKPELKDGDLLIDVSQDDDGSHEMAITGVKYLSSSNHLDKGKTETILIEGYNNEPFTLAIGEAVYEFGDKREGKESITELLQQPTQQQRKPLLARAASGTVNALKSLAAGIKNLLVGAIRLAAKVPSGITGRVTAEIQEQPARQQGATGEMQAVEQPTKTPDKAKQPETQPEIQNPEAKPVSETEKSLQKKPEPRVEFITIGHGGSPASPLGQEAQKKQTQTIEQKVYVTTAQPFTFISGNITVPFDLTTKISRSIECNKCDDFSVPANSEVIISIKATNFNEIESGNLIEYYPAGWQVIDANGGNATSHNTTHNMITWHITQAQRQVEKKYTAKTTSQRKESYNFASELSSVGKTITENRNILVEPFNVIVKTPENDGIKSKVKITRIKRETRDEVVVDLEFNVSTTKIQSITLSNVTITKNETVSFGFDDVPETKIEFSGKNFVKVFAVDPSNITFETGTLSAIAKGTRLLKCEDWDFNSQICSGSWKEAALLIPGLPYSITLNASDPAWAEEGLVAINTHKSIYAPGDLAKIGIGILNNNGNMVCNASVMLVITSPSGTKTAFTTENGSIAVSNQCRIYGVTNEPDYFTNFTVTEIGSYEMNLTAITPDGEPYMLSNFSVQENVSFDIERIGPTRIYPLEAYDFNFSIKANENFAGNITEIVPASFVITETEAMVIEDGSSKLIVWNATLANGSSYNLSYSFDAPDTSPFRYELGPLSIGNFSEQRMWQIASDAPAKITWTVNAPSPNPTEETDFTIQIDGACSGAACSGTMDILHDVQAGGCAPVTTMLVSCGATIMQDGWTDLALGGGCTFTQSDYNTVAYSCSAAGNTGSLTANVHACPSSAATYEVGTSTTTAQTVKEGCNSGVVIVPAPADTTPPNNTIILPVGNTNFSGSFIVNASANDSQSDVNNVNLSLLRPGSRVGPIAMNLSVGGIRSGYFTVTVNPSALGIADNIYNLSVNATDSAGNTNISENVTIRIDTAGPNASIVVPLNGTAFTNNEKFLINASVNDTLSKVFNATFRITSQSTTTAWMYAQRSSGNSDQGYWNATFDSSTLTDGTYNITINATDFAGNQKLINISFINIDRQAPNNTLITPLARSNISGNLFINASINDSGATVQKVNVTIYNNTGNATSLILMSLGAGNTQNGYWNATISTATLRDGNYNISVNATNNNARINISANLSIVVDNTKANVTMIAPLNNTIVSGTIVVNASVNDSITGIRTVLFRFIRYDEFSLWQTATKNSGNIQQGYWDIAFNTGSVSNNLFNITINATDFAGNQQIVNISQVTVSNGVDTDAPNISIVSPSANINHSGNLFVNASINDTGAVASVNVSLHNITGNVTGFIPMALNSGTVSNGYWVATIDTASLIPLDGIYNISVNASDSAGNVNISKNVSITIDNTPVNSSIVFPLNNTNITSNFLINASVNDSITGVFNITFRIINSLSSTAWLKATKGAGSIYQGYWNMTFDISTLSDGFYNITANVSDFAGNKQLANISKITIDRTEPNALIVVPATGTTQSDNLLINASVNDTHAKISSVKFRIINSTTYNSGWITADLNSGDDSVGYWNVTFNTNLLRNTVYNITINATDFAGNQNISNISKITILNQVLAAGENEKVLLRAQKCLGEDGAGSANTFTSACDGSYPGICGASNDLVDCDDSAPEAHSRSNGKFGGVNITAYNTSIINCGIITSVRICYDRWKTGAETVDSCLVSVDTAAGASWSNADTSCAPNSESGIVCTDVSALESWACSTFFGPSATGATAKVEDRRTAGGAGTDLSVDVLYFNVTYETATIIPPGTIIINPVAYANLSGNVLVNASIIDVDDIVVKANLTIFNNTGNATGLIPMTLGAGTSINGYWNATFNSAALRDDFYNLSVNATDSSGNINITKNLSVAIDNTKANASIVAPLNGSAKSGNMLINASVNDSLSKVFNATFRLTNPLLTGQWLFASIGSGNIGQGYWNTTFNTATINDGTYNITINATDFAGNQNIINISQIVINNQAPNNTITLPVANANVSGNMLVNASINDTAGLVTFVNVTLYNNTGNATSLILMSLGAGTASNGYWNATIATTTLLEGNYNISVNATDSSGNINISKNVSITVDNTNANASITAPLNGTNISANFLINASVNDSRTGLFNVSFRLINQLQNSGWYYSKINTGTIFAGFWNTTADISALNDNIYNITVNATDFAGNEKLINISQIVIDKTPPNATIAIPQNGTVFTNQNVLINASVNDSVSKVFNVTFRLTTSDGSTVTKWLYATLLRGTTAEGFWNTTVDSSILINNGFYNITVNTTDYAGNQNLVNISQIEVSNTDNTPPNNSIIIPFASANISGIFLVNASVNDSQNDVNDVNLSLLRPGSIVAGPIAMGIGAGALRRGYFNVTFDSLTVADNIYNLSVNATDAVGNTNISLNVTIVIDNTKPNVSAISPINGSILQDEAIIINASVNDSLSKIMNVSFRLTTSNGASVTKWLYANLSGTTAVGFWNATIHSNQLANGWHNITINATDFAGNQQIINITQIRIDNDAPNATIIFPIANSNISGNMLVNASINDTAGFAAFVNLTLLNNTGNATLLILMSLGAGTASKGYWNATINTATLRDGNYNISVNATDEARNTNITQNVSVIIDNTKINASMVVPANRTNELGLLLINASVNDSLTGVFNTTYRLTNARGNIVTEWIYAEMATGTIAQGYWNATIDMSTLPQGRYNITINATDFAGNQLVANLSEILSDDIPPNNTITIPYQFGNVSGNVNVIASINDTAAGVSKVNLTLFNNTGNATGPLIMSITSGSVISGSWSVTFDSTSPALNLRDGNYNLSVNATDYAGNINISTNMSIIIDNTFPNVSVELPVADTVFSDENFLINASVNDSLTKVAKVSYRLSNYDGSTVTAWFAADLNLGNIAQGYWNKTVSSNSLNNGVYNITINATDFAGNQNISNITQININNIPPNNTVIIPVQNANLSGSFLINASINDSGGVSRVNLTIFNNTGNVTALVPMSLGAGTIIEGYWNATINSLTFPDNSYNISVNASDNVGNINISLNVSITIDNTRPNISLVVPVNETTVSGLTLINTSVNDSVSKIFNVTYRLTTADGSTVTKWLYAELTAGTIAQGYWNATIDMRAIAEGIYNITANATDFAGNQNVLNISEIISDTIPPNNTIIFPLAGANVSGNQFVNVSINDTASGAFRVNLTILDINGPTIGEVSMTLGAGTPFKGYWNGTFNSLSLDDGKYNLSVNATDRGGRINISANLTIVVDNTFPNVSIVVPQTDSVFAEEAILINASVNDSVTGIFNATFRLTTANGQFMTEWLYAQLTTGTIAQGYWNTTINSNSLSNGLYNITINATDFAGNSEVSNISQISIENVPPNVSIIQPTAGLNVSGKLFVNASINDTGFVALVNVSLLNNTGNATGLIQMSLGAGTTREGWWNATIDTTLVLDGYYNVSINATDNVGNINISSNVSVIIDNTKANASIAAPSNGTSFNREIFLINASVNDSLTGIFNATFRVINRLGATQWIYASRSSGSIYQGYWNATVDSRIFADGFYNITVNATDFAGNQLLANISSIAVDNDAPNTTLIRPLRNANISGAFTINASINDTGGFVQSVNATLYNNTGNATGFIQMTLGAGTATAGYWNATFDGSTLRDGRYNISVNATNNYGNINISMNTSITIDNTAANATIATPVNGTNMSGNAVINASVNDSLSGIASVTFKLYNNTGNASLWIAANRSSGNIMQGYWNITLTTASIPDNNYNVTINATDFAGNSVIANISSISTDNTKPTITLSTPPNATSNDTTSVAFTATASDNSGALQSCSLLINGTINKTLSPLSAGQELNLTVEGFNEGGYLWNVQCTDTAGNTNRAPKNFTLSIDLNAPTSNITTANGSFFNSNTPNITINLTDSLDNIINYTMFVNGEKNHNSTVFSNNATNATLLFLNEGTYSVLAEALDDAGHRVNSSPINFTIDMTVPFVGLIAPANNTNITTIAIQFNFTASDNVDAFLDCGLYIDAVLNQTVGLASGNSTNISIANFTSGLHGWNVSCIDDAQNLNWSQNWFFNVTQPDLEILAENISFNTTAFEENRNFTVFANITNKGEREVVNALVELINNSADGNVLATSFVSMPGGGNATINLTIAYPIGTYAIVVRLDGTNTIPEKDESNNIANKSFTIPMWDTIVGNATGSLVIANQNNTAYIFSWIAANQSPGNIFVADIDSQIQWSNLTALSRNITGNYSEDDFAQLDTAINSTGYNDSINRTFTWNYRPRENISISIFSRVVTGVPVVNSTNTSSFRTGILWDANDSSSGEYNGSQDVVFVTQMNTSQLGQYGKYDYEIKVPATLRKLKGPDFRSVVFYMELT